MVDSGPPDQGAAGVAGGPDGRGSRAGGPGASERDTPGGVVAAGSGGTGGGEPGGGQQRGTTGADGAGASTPQTGAVVANLPPDIPADGTGEDQVARQLREAALAEKDPKVREALWDQYRRHTGIRK